MLLFSIFFSCIAGILTIVALVICSINIIQLRRNPPLRMGNGGPRFIEVEKVKTQTIFDEIVR